MNKEDIARYIQTNHQKLPVHATYWKININQISLVNTQYIRSTFYKSDNMRVRSFYKPISKLFEIK
jgi:hypothetical protein